VTPPRPPVTYFCIVSLGPIALYMYTNLKSLASAVPEIQKRCQNLNGVHMTPPRPLMTYFCIVFVMARSLVYACKISSLASSIPEIGGCPKI